MKILKEQVIPLILTIVAFFLLSGLLYAFINLLNIFPANSRIELKINLADVLVGLTIYLKTSIDFAIFIGNLMKNNTGLKKRIAIEFGTAAGNAFGTLFVLFIWYFLKEAPLLLFFMIVIASFVLLRMAQESLEEFLTQGSFLKLHRSISFLNEQIRTINNIAKPVIGRIIPSTSMTNSKEMTFFSLLLFSFTIPFILGLDDFAGYIPLFSIVNVFGFAIGAFLGHMLLNIALFISPKRTTLAVEHPLVLSFGGMAFLLIAAWGFFEALRIILNLF